LGKRSPDRLRALLVASVVATTATVTAGCGGKDPFNPGASVGTFHVTARLAKTTCGAAPDPWEFDVRLNHDGATLYWIQGGVPISGKVDASARTALQASTVADLRAADPRKRLAACSVARSDLLDVALAGANAEPVTDPALTTSFRGVLAYGFTPTDGSDCSDQVTAAGGDFAALPCNVSYNVVGAYSHPSPTY
jgi:hypothetical protein